VATGWQDICTQFHRKHPETLKNCIESDLELSAGIAPGSFKAYRCKNHMWDIATPMVVGGKHMGNLYLGQFFYDDEVTDFDCFRSQAKRYDFNETAYLAALDRVPRWSKETVHTVMRFYTRFTELISELSYSNLKLAHELKAHESTIISLKQSETKIAEALSWSQESEEKYRILFEQTSDALFVAQNGRIVFQNPRTFELTGYSLEEFQSRPFASFIHEDDREMVVGRHFQRLNGEKPPERYGFRIFHKNGHILWTELKAVLIQWDQKPAVLCFMTDITERKQMEARLLQAQKLEAMGRLAGGVAHDFNNMLGVILGYKELALLRTDDNHKLKADLKEIQKAAQRSADITKQLLAFARKQTISPRKLDLNDTVESMLKMLRRLIGEDIDLVWKPFAHLWPVKMDPTQIDQILANLCVNARDAIAGVGKVTIETGMKTFDPAYCAAHQGFIPGDFVMLAVSDNGCGMAKETLNNLFEPFFTTKDIGEGTGLGLATIYGIVKQNNGFINV
jgi:PAS domain S-box-containing protein